MRNCSLIVSIGLLFCASAPVAVAGKQQANTKNRDIQVEKGSIQPKVTYKFSEDVSRGHLVKDHDGKPGSIKRTYKVVERNGRSERVLIKEECSLPRDSTYLMSRGGYPSSRGSFTRARVIDMVATAYTDSPSENGGSTRARLGNELVDGVVAVDPRVIPLGTKLYVEGYGFAYACDTGSAIKGNRIDLLMPSFSASNNWGRRHVKVHVLSGRD